MTPAAKITSCAKMRITRQKAPAFGLRNSNHGGVFWESSIFLGGGINGEDHMCINTKAHQTVASQAADSAAQTAKMTFHRFGMIEP